jgi:hypothetical protein
MRGCPISSGSRPGGAARGATGVSLQLDRLILAAGILSAAAGAAFLARAGGYYLLPLWDRPDSPLHRILRPSGEVGHSFGWIGAGLMLLGVALYSGRKRLGAMQGRGPMRTWLNFHIYLCLTGPFLVALHTAGKLRGLGVYSFWSMVVVAASGIAGRWLYQQFPRTIRGETMTLAEIRAEQAELRERLQSAFGLAPSLLKEVEAVAERSGRRVPGGAAAGLHALPLLLLDDLLRPLRLAKIRRRLLKQRRLARRETQALLALIRRQMAIARRVAFLDTFRRVFTYWHVIHLAFFAAMLTLLLLHVGAEVFFGAPLVGGR